MSFDGILATLVQTVLGGGPETIALLILFIIVLLLERRSLKAELAKKEEKLDKIIDEYYRGNITLSEALNSLKSVLYEIKSKI